MKPHEVLGVASDATQAQIKRAYRRLAFRHHPDRGGSENKFLEVSEAYKRLARVPPPGRPPLCPADLESARPQDPIWGTDDEWAELAQHLGLPRIPDDVHDYYDEHPIQDITDYNPNRKKLK